MTMGPDHGRDAAVAEMPHRVLLGARLTVEIEQDRGDRAELVLGEQPLDGGEGIVDRVHKQPRHRIDDHHLPAVRHAIDAEAAAGRPGREVDRPQQPRIAADIGHDLRAGPRCDCRW